MKRYVRFLEFGYKDERRRIEPVESSMLAHLKHEIGTAERMLRIQRLIRLAAVALHHSDPLVRKAAIRVMQHRN